MTKTRLILVASCIIVFAAGAAAGVLASKLKAPRPRGSWLSRELKLTGQQEEQMRKIWRPAGTARQGRHDDRMAVLARERDEAIVALLSEEQKAGYDAIGREYARKVDELAQERHKAFEERMAQTKQILTPEQARRYDELLKEPRGRGRGRGGRGGPGPGPGEGPSTSPTHQETETPGGRE